MPAAAWRLGITYPQSIKRLGHCLTADNISAGTPNGGKDISGAMEQRPGGWAYPALWILYFRNQDTTQFPLPDCPSCSVSPLGEGWYLLPAIVEPEVTPTPL